MKNTIKERIWRRTIELFYKESVIPQEQIDTGKDRYAFDKRMEKVLPIIEKYVALRLLEAIKNKVIPEGKYKTEDLIDELYIEAYNHFKKVREDVNLYEWLLDKAKDLIENTIVEVDFNQAFIKNIDDYIHEEWDEMEEKYSVDANGELVMEEDLDDISYLKHDYILDAAFIQNTNYEA